MRLNTSKRVIFGPSFTASVGFHPSPFILELSINFLSVPSALLRSHSIAPVNRTASGIASASSRMVKSSPYGILMSNQESATLQCIDRKSSLLPPFSMERTKREAASCRNCQSRLCTETHSAAGRCAMRACWRGVRGWRKRDGRALNLETAVDRHQSRGTPHQC